MHLGISNVQSPASRYAGKLCTRGDCSCTFVGATPNMPYLHEDHPPRIVHGFHNWFPSLHLLSCVDTRGVGVPA